MYRKNIISLLDHVRDVWKNCLVSEFDQLSPENDKIQATLCPDYHPSPIAAALFVSFMCTLADYPQESKPSSGWGDRRGQESLSTHSGRRNHSPERVPRNNCERRLRTECWTHSKRAPKHQLPQAIPNASRHDPVRNTQFATGD